MLLRKIRAFLAPLSVLQTWATPEGVQAPAAPGRGQSSSSSAHTGAEITTANNTGKGELTQCEALQLLLASLSGFILNTLHYLGFPCSFLAACFLWYSFFLWRRLCLLCWGWSDDGFQFSFWSPLLCQQLWVNIGQHSTTGYGDSFQ